MVHSRVKPTNTDGQGLEIVFLHLTEKNLAMFATAGTIDNSYNAQITLTPLERFLLVVFSKKS